MGAEIMGTVIGLLISLAFYIFLGYWICRGIAWFWKEYTGCAIGCTVYVVISVAIGLFPLISLLRSTASVSDLSVGYLTEEAYAHGEFNDSAITETADFAVGEPQYVVIDFRIKTKKKNDGNELIALYTSVSDGNALDVTIQDAPTGKIEVSENNAAEICTYYTIPSKKRDERTVRVILKIVPRYKGEYSLDIVMKGYGIEIKGELERTVPIRVNS